MREASWNTETIQMLQGREHLDSYRKFAAAIGQSKTQVHDSLTRNKPTLAIARAIRATYGISLDRLIL